MSQACEGSRRDVNHIIRRMPTTVLKNGAVHTQNDQSHGNDFFCSWHQALSFRVRNPRRTAFILKKNIARKIVAFRKKWETTKRKGSKAKKKKYQSLQ